MSSGTSGNTSVLSAIAVRRPSVATGSNSQPHESAPGFGLFTCQRSFTLRQRSASDQPTWVPRSSRGGVTVLPQPSIVGPVRCPSTSSSPAQRFCSTQRRGRAPSAESVKDSPVSVGATTSASSIAGEAPSPCSAWVPARPPPQPSAPRRRPRLATLRCTGCILVRPAVRVEFLTVTAGSPARTPRSAPCRRASCQKSRTRPAGISRGDRAARPRARSGSRPVVRAS